MAAFRTNNALAVVSIIATATYGCGFLGPGDEPRLTTYVSVSPDTVSVGDSVNVTVVAHNETDEVLVVATGDCPLVYRVRRARGAEVFPHAWLCTPLPITTDFAPGDSLSRTYVYPGIELDPGDHSWSTRRPLEPGLYWIQGCVSSSCNWVSTSAVVTVVPQ